jgi:hypothetical protein
VKKVLVISADNGSLLTTTLIPAENISHVGISYASKKEGVEVVGVDETPITPILNVFKLDGTELNFDLDANVTMEFAGTDHKDVLCSQVTGFTIERDILRFLEEEPR